jgi:hypothetical protein
MYENLSKITVSKECLNAFRNGFEQELLAKAISLDELLLEIEEDGGEISKTLTSLGKIVTNLFSLSDEIFTDEEKGKLLQKEIEKNPNVKRDKEFCYNQFIAFISSWKDKNAKVGVLEKEIEQLENRIEKILEKIVR